MLRLCLLKLLRQSKLDECQPLTATGAISFFFSRKKEKETIISRNNRETILKSMTTVPRFLVVCIRTRRIKIIVKTMRKRANRINLQSILEFHGEEAVSCDFFAI